MSSIVSPMGVATESPVHGPSFVDDLMAEAAEAGILRKRELAALILSRHAAVFTVRDLEQILDRRPRTIRQHVARAKLRLKRLAQMPFGKS
jgi:hypothetical protein